MIVAAPLLLATIVYAVILWRAGNARVTRRDREASAAIRKHGQCTRVVRLK